MLQRSLFRAQLGRLRGSTAAAAVNRPLLGHRAFCLWLMIALVSLHVRNEALFSYMRPLSEVVSSNLVRQPTVIQVLRPETGACICRNMRFEGSRGPYDSF